MEVLVVLTIILVLAGLVLATSSFVQNKGARSRAEVEIAAMSAALENYKADNGIYPGSILDPATTTPSSYEDASATLYESLAGDPDGDGQPDPAITSYMQFKPNQLGSNNSKMFIKDPFGNSYGYSTLHETDPSKGFNPTFDLWSTAGSRTRLGENGLDQELVARFSTAQPGWSRYPMLMYHHHHAAIDLLLLDRRIR